MNGPGKQLICMVKYLPSFGWAFGNAKSSCLESDFCLPLSEMCLFRACKRLGSVVNLKAYFVCSFVGCWVGGDIYLEICST